MRPPGRSGTPMPTATASTMNDSASRWAAESLRWLTPPNVLPYESGRTYTFAGAPLGRLPGCDFDGASVVGFSALLRWRWAWLGLVPFAARGEHVCREAAAVRAVVDDERPDRSRLVPGPVFRTHTRLVRPPVAPLVRLV